MMDRRLGLAGVFALGLGCAVHSAAGDERRFTFTQEATTLPKGGVDFENWFTYKRGTPEDSTFNRFEFRHELEFGLSDSVQLAVYLADWSRTSGEAVQ